MRLIWYHSVILFSFKKNTSSFAYLDGLTSGNVVCRFKQLWVIFCKKLYAEECRDYYTMVNKRVKHHRKSNIHHNEMTKWVHWDFRHIWWQNILSYLPPIPQRYTHHQPLYFGKIIHDAEIIFSHKCKLFKKIRVM